MAMDRKKSLRRRHMRVRQKVRGTADRPRLCIHKTSRHLYAQLVDDEAHRTLAAVTTNSKTAKDSSDKKSFCSVDWAKRLGKDIGEKALESGVKAIVFDRGGYRYHGCIKSFAEAARKTGLIF